MHCTSASIISLVPMKLNALQIADIAHWGWVAAAGWAGIDIDHFPALKAWEERMWERPALQKGANVPTPYKMKELLANKDEIEKHAQQGRDWVQKGMREDADALASRGRGSKV